MKHILILIFAVALTKLVYGQMANRLDKLDVNDLNAKKLTVQSTTVASKPCPAMTEVQREALTGMIEGQCVFNTTTKKLNIYDSLEWVEAGSGGDGGISNWESGKAYKIDDVVIESAKIYQANTDHTSTVFASQIANWNLISGVVLNEATGTLDAAKIGNGSVSNTEFQRLDGVTSGIQGQIDGKQATITGAATSITSSNLTASRAVVSDASGKVAASSVSSTELGYLSGATSNIQNQLDSKGVEITGAATTIVTNDLTASRAVVSDASGKVAASAVTSAEIGNLSGSTSNIQTQINSKQATITGAATTITSSNLATSRALVSDGSGKVAASDVTSTELSYVDGVTSSIQTQIDSKEPIITGGATTITGTNLTASRALVSNSTGKVAVSAVTNTELGYLDGVTSAIQTQLDGKESTITTLPLSKGGSNKALTANNGAVAYSDADSLELLAPGTSGQILQSNGASAPSFVNKSITGKGQYQSSVTAEQIHVPNSQLTPVNTNQQLIETGNNNILINPGFEHSTVSTGWTSSAGTVTANTTLEIQGLKALQVSLTAQTLGVSQNSTLYQSQFADGIQGMASAYVKTSVPGVKLCPRKAGATQTQLCVPHTGSGKWEQLKVPFILSETSNGLIVMTDSAQTGLVYIDDAFVGAANVEAAQAFDTTCDTIGCETSFVAQANNSFGVSNENLDWISSCSTTSTGVATCTFNSGVFSLAPICTATSFGTNLNIIDITPTANNVVVRITNNAGAFVSAGFHINCQKQGADYAAAIQAQKDFEKTRIASYTAKNADTDWQSFTPGLTGFTSSGTNAYNVGFWKRNGSNLELNITTRMGSTGTASDIFRWQLPNNLQIDFSKLPGDTSGGRTPIGTGLWYDRSALIWKPIVASADTSGIWLQPTAPSNAGDQIAPLYAPTNSDDTFNFNISLPVVGWEQSNFIIGQFNGLEKCDDSYECTDVFSAKVSAAGVVSDENVDWINGSCSYTTGNWSCNFNSSIFTVSPNCTASSQVNRFVRVNAATSSAVSGITYNDSGATDNQAFQIICQKQGADYIGKTAKAVASDQNIATPGVNKVKACFSAYGGAGSLTSRTSCSSSPCLEYYDSCSVSTATRSATGQYPITFANGSFAPNSLVSCSCSTEGGSFQCVLSSGTVTDSAGGLTTEIRTATLAGVLTDRNFNISCTGQSP